MSIDLSWARSDPNFATRRQLTLFSHTKAQSQGPVVKVWSSLPNDVVKTLVTQNMGTDSITFDQANISHSLFSDAHKYFYCFLWPFDMSSARLIPSMVQG